MQRTLSRRALLSGVLSLFVPVTATVALAQSGMYTPKPGSPERKALMDALRVPVEKDLKRKVIFKVNRLKVSGNWAFMSGVPLQADGSKMDYRNTKYADAIKYGAFDDWVCALYKKKNGKWKLVTHVLGATDVAWDGWDKEYGAPREIFGTGS